MSLTKVSFSMVSGAEINILDFGADPTGMTDSTSAIQAAITYAQSLGTGQRVVVPSGNYATSGTISITAPNISLMGLGFPSISYTGSGIAISVGKAPGVNGDYIGNIIIQDLRILVVNSTQIGLRVWHAENSYFNHIDISGNAGAGKYGLAVYAGINNIFELVNIIGIGKIPVSGYSNCLEYGLYATLGYGNILGTVTVFRNCYFHYCNTGAYVSYLYQFEDCVFEASNVGVQGATDALMDFNRCWWEGISQYDMAFSNNNVTVKNSRINSDPRQQYFNSGGGLYSLTVEDTNFSTTHPNPFLFGTSPSGSNIFNPGLTVPGRVVLNRNNYPDNFVVGYIYNNNSVNMIQVEDMPKTTYMFGKTSVGASSSTSAIPAEFGFTKYVVPEYGHLISIEAWAANTITAGNCSVAVAVNGADAITANLTSSSQRVLNRIAPYQKILAAGDVLTVSLNTSASWSPSNDVMVGVVVANGPDGIGL